MIKNPIYLIKRKLDMNSLKSNLMSIIQYLEDEQHKLINHWEISYSTKMKISDDVISRLNSQYYFDQLKNVLSFKMSEILESQYITHYDEIVNCYRSLMIFDWNQQYNQHLDEYEYQLIKRLSLISSQLIELLKQSKHDLQSENISIKDEFTNIIRSQLRSLNNIYQFEIENLSFDKLYSNHHQKLLKGYSILDDIVISQIDNKIHVECSIKFINSIMLENESDNEMLLINFSIEIDFDLDIPDLIDENVILEQVNQHVNQQIKSFIDNSDIINYCKSSNDKLVEDIQSFDYSIFKK